MALHDRLSIAKEVKDKGYSIFGVKYREMKRIKEKVQVKCKKILLKS